MRRDGTIWFFSLLLTGAIALCGRDAAAEDDPAKQHYLEGKAHFEAGRFEEALDAFKESYNLSGKPELLFNLGLAAESLGDVQRALAYYELYLEELPDASDAGDIRARIEALRSGEQPGAPTSLPEEEPSVPSPVEVAPEPVAPPAKDSTEPGYELSLEGPTQDAPREIFWPAVVVGGGVLVLAGGTITAITAKNKYDGLETSCSPSCSDAEVRSAKGPAIAADIQFALGAIAVAGGAAWWIWDLLQGGGDEGQGAQSSHFKLLPAAGSSAGGLSVEGRF